MGPKDCSTENCAITNCLPTGHLIKTGNLFSDIVNNFVEIIKREQREDKGQKLKYIRRLHEVYDGDVITVPRTPCIAVSFDSWSEGARTIGQKYPQAMHIEANIVVHYYHQELNNKIKDIEIRDALWEISRILRRNSDLNGLSSKGATIEEGVLAVRVKQNKVYVGGVIHMTVPVLFEERRGVTPVQAHGHRDR